MSEPGPREIDVSKPSAARLYDLYLGGTHNYAVDQAFAARVLEIAPIGRDFARQNRDFLRRAVRYCVGQGIEQFLDIGSGVPTVGNVHEVAQEQLPSAHVVYVDNDLEAVTASRELLRGQSTVTAIDADLRQPSAILNHPDTRRLIDFERPMALLMVSTLPFISAADDAQELMATYRQALPPGSYLVLSHITMDDAAAEIREQLRKGSEAYDETASPMAVRTLSEFSQFFDGLQLADPGIVYAPDWRPDEPVDLESLARPCNYAAVGYKA